MGFNYAGLQQKVSRYTEVVSDWVRQVGKLYYSGIPQDVPVKLLDDNGNVVTKTMPNVAQFRKKVWDDVGGALGQFNKTVYVDAIVGDDNNAGTMTSPFASIEKAVMSAPTGARVNVLIKESQAHVLDNNIVVDGKVVIVNRWGSNGLKPTIKFNIHYRTNYPDNSFMSYFSVVGGSILMVKDVKFDIVSPSASKPYNSLMYGGQPILLDGAQAAYLERVDCDLSSATGASVITNASYNSQPTITVWFGDYKLESGFLVSNRYNSPIVYHQYGAVISASTSTLYQQIRYINRDADSGNPVNIISNINFSS